jgi:hypothetical protein
MCAEGRLGYGLMKATRLGKLDAMRREAGRVEKQEYCMGGEDREERREGRGGEGELKGI